MIKFVIQTRNFPCKAHVIEGSTYVILNRDFLKKYSSKIDFDKVFIELSSEEILFLYGFEADDVQTMRIFHLLPRRNLR